MYRVVSLVVYLQMLQCCWQRERGCCQGLWMNVNRVCLNVTLIIVFLVHNPSIRSIPVQVGMSGGGTEDGEVLEDSRPPSHNYEWLLVAAAIDRIAVVVFIITFFSFWI